MLDRWRSTRGRCRGERTPVQVEDLRCFVHDGKPTLHRQTEPWDMFSSAVHRCLSLPAVSCSWQRGDVAMTASIRPRAWRFAEVSHGRPASAPCLHVGPALATLRPIVAQWRGRGTWAGARPFLCRQGSALARITARHGRRRCPHRALPLVHSVPGPIAVQYLASRRSRRSAHGPSEVTRARTRRPSGQRAPS